MLVVLEHDGIHDWMLPDTAQREPTRIHTSVRYPTTPGGVSLEHDLHVPVKDAGYHPAIIPAESLR